MKNKEQILDVYAQSAQVGQLQALAAAKSPARIQLKGMVGSQPSFVLGGLQMLAPGTHLYICADKEAAAYFQNNMIALLGGEGAYFFPDSFKRPMQFDALNTGNVLSRTEAVNKLTATTQTGKILVTYPAALFEKVVSPRVLNDHKIEVIKGERLDAETAIELLTDFGFTREDFVYEPGQFAIRGEIIDVYSYGNDYPYRIDRFDDEVESIRTFDPMTQLSIKEITRVSIIPNINTKFSESQKVALFEVLPENTTIWIADFQLLKEQLELCYREAIKLSETISSFDNVEIAAIFKEQAFIRPGDLIADLERFSLFFLERHKLPFPIQNVITFDAKPQPNFNKNFTLLIKDLKKHHKEGMVNYIFADNPKQIERFYAIFEDMEANVDFHPIQEAIHEGFIDRELKVACYTDHQIFQRFHRYKLKRGFTKDKALSLKMLRELKPGDFVTHIDHGVGRFSGLEKIDINGHTQESVRLIYKNNDLLYVSINSMHKIAKFAVKEGTTPKLSKLGSEAWKNLKKKTKRKVKDIAAELIKLYAKRKASPGHTFPPDGYLQNELEASFIYEDTPDQYAASQAVKEDMMKDYPMDRLVCGDVGFGKTEVAIRAAFKAVIGGKQVAILVPTTILALQHFSTFSERLKEFGVTVDYVNRFRTAKEKREIFSKLKEGKIDLVIGTHGLLNKDVGFKDLGLLIIDEEQKFGVAAKEKLRNIKINVDTLTLTATPIPRTLQFSLMAARDLSIIRTPPPNRQPIHTEVRIFHEDLVREAIYYEINRGGQVFFVHNRVKDLADMTAIIRRSCPDIEIGMAHGQMESKLLEKTLLDFINKRYDVLISTNIIETGLDIPNANTIIINNAHHFGMSDLHQLRGRVGRSNKKAYCYLFSQPMSVLSSDARKRLKTLEEFSDLGSGFNIAMKDLDIRGAGNMLGAEQSGFISDIGYETYQRILAEAIQELKETKFKELFKEELEQDRDFVHDVQIDTDIEMMIPDDYVSNIQERLSLYTQLDHITKEEDLTAFAKMLKDRFGPIPKAVLELFDGLRLRWICRKLGFDRVILKSNKLRCFFVENPQSLFYESATFNSIMAFMASGALGTRLTMKQSGKRLMIIKEKVPTLKAAKKVLEGLVTRIS